MCTSYIQIEYITMKHFIIECISSMFKLTRRFFYSKTEQRHHGHASNNKTMHEHVTVDETRLCIVRMTFFFFVGRVYILLLINS